MSGRWLRSLASLFPFPDQFPDPLEERLVADRRERREEAAFREAHHLMDLYPELTAREALNQARRLR